MQRAIRAVFMRGGSSKAMYLRTSDLPPPGALRDATLFRLHGLPDENQIDGIHAGDGPSSKVAIVGEPSVPEADVDYTYAELHGEAHWWENDGNCLGISAGVGSFAVDQGMCVVEPGASSTAVRIHNTNTGHVLHATVKVNWESGQAAACVDGDCSIRWVPGTGSEIELDFSHIQGNATGSLLPTGKVCESLKVAGADGDNEEQINATFLDFGQPTVFITAESLGLTENPEVVWWHPLRLQQQLSRIERIRGAAAVQMGLVESREQALRGNRDIPFVVVVWPPQLAGCNLQAVCIYEQQMHHPVVPQQLYCKTITFIATGIAALLSGTVVHEVTTSVTNRVNIVTPAGVIEVHGEVQDGEEPFVVRASIMSTARKLMDGHVYIPWEV